MYFRNILDLLQGISDSTPARRRSRVGDWYRPHLGSFLYVNKDGVLCHSETTRPCSDYGGQSSPSSTSGPPPEIRHEVGGNAGSSPGPSMPPMESLVYNDLVGTIEGGGIFWPDLTQATDSTDELVFSYSFTLRF